MTTAEADKYLPGGPSKRRIKEVRRHLKWFGITPNRIDLWRLTWQWANAIAISYWNTHWPLSTEIASQYVLLLLAEMKNSAALKLPYRAATHAPEQVQRYLTSGREALLKLTDEKANDKAKD